MIKLRVEVAKCEHSGYDFALSAHRWRARSRKHGSTEAVFAKMLRYSDHRLFKGTPCRLAANGMTSVPE